MTTPSTSANSGPRLRPATNPANTPPRTVSQRDRGPDRDAPPAAGPRSTFPTPSRFARMAPGSSKVRSRSIIDDDLAAGSGGQGDQGDDGQVLADESHRTVTECQV